MRAVIETPLKADTPEGFRRNFLFLVWCAHAMAVVDHLSPIASHGWCPFYLDDRDPLQRELGIAWPFAWDRANPHWIFEDLGQSGGMRDAIERCKRENIAVVYKRLQDYHRPSWEGFQRGVWPGTMGFALDDGAAVPAEPKPVDADDVEFQPVTTLKGADWYWEDANGALIHGGTL